MNPLLTAALGGLLRREHLRKYMVAESERRREVRLQAMRRRRLRLAADDRHPATEGAERAEPES
jgi:hypothetical protein